MITIYHLLLSSQLLIGSNVTENQGSFSLNSSVTISHVDDNEPLVKITPGTLGSGVMYIESNGTATNFIVLNTIGGVVMIVPCSGIITTVNIDSLPKGVYTIRAMQDPVVELLIKE